MRVARPVGPVMTIWSNDMGRGRRRSVGGQVEEREDSIMLGSRGRSGEGIYMHYIVYGIAYEGVESAKISKGHEQGAARSSV
jgi:hypothetical protein